MATYQPMLADDGDAERANGSITRAANGHAHHRSSLDDEIDGLDADAVELDDAYWAEEKD